MFDKMREKARIRRVEFASSLYDVTAERYTKIYDTEGKEAADAYAECVQPLLDKCDKRARR
jgi:hypothetical protein